MFHVILERLRYNSQAIHKLQCWGWYLSSRCSLRYIDRVHINSDRSFLLYYIYRVYSNCNRDKCDSKAREQGPYTANWYPDYLYYILFRCTYVVKSSYVAENYKST